MSPVDASDVAALAGARDGVTVSLEQHASRLLGHPLPYRLVVPANRSRDVTLLLLLHGRGGQATSWDEGIAALLRAETAGRFGPHVVVAPGSGTRWWVDGPEPLERVVLQELLPAVRDRLQLAGTVPHVVAGVSMGGYGAVRYVLHHPDVFAAAIALSPALYHALPPAASSARTSGSFGTPFDDEAWQRRNYPAALAARRDAPRREAIFVSTGDEEAAAEHAFPHGTTIASKRFVASARAHGYDAIRLVETPGGHDWRHWQPAFIEGLRYVHGVLGTAPAPRAPR